MKREVVPPSSHAGPAAVVSPHALPPGSRVGVHVIDSVLSAGEFGIVYHAVDPMLRRAVALKEYFVDAFCARDGDGQVVLRNADDQARFVAGRQAFVEEARLLAHLDVPGLLPVTGLFEDRGTVYRVMPFAPGRTLAGWRAQYTDRMDEGALRHLLLDLMRPLEALHAANLVHGYVLPDQVILGEGRPALLLGFGTVRRTLQAPADPLFTPIEQLPSGGHLPRGAWSDVYALAALARFAMAPAGGRVSAAPTAHALRARAPIGATLAQALERALAPQPGERPQSIAALREAMGPLVADMTVQLDVTLPTEPSDMTATRPLPRPSLADTERPLGRMPIVRQTPPPPPWLAASASPMPPAPAAAVPVRPSAWPTGDDLAGPREHEADIALPLADMPVSAAAAARVHDSDAAAPAADARQVPEAAAPDTALQPLDDPRALAEPEPASQPAPAPASALTTGTAPVVTPAEAPEPPLLDPIPQLMAAVVQEHEALLRPPGDAAKSTAPHIEPSFGPPAEPMPAPTALPSSAVSSSALPSAPPPAPAPLVEPVAEQPPRPAPPVRSVLQEPEVDGEETIDEAVRAAIAAAIDSLPPAPPRGAAVHAAPGERSDAGIPRIELPPPGMPLPGAPARNADETWAAPPLPAAGSRRWMYAAAALLVLVVVAGIAWRALVAGPEAVGAAPAVPPTSTASEEPVSRPAASPASRRHAAA